MMRLVAWLIRWLGPHVLLSLTLLLVALGGVAFGLADAVRGLDAGLLLPLTVLGLLLGWVLAKSPLPFWLAGVVGVVLGAEVALLRIGRLGKPLVELLQRLLSLSWGVWRWPLNGPLDARPVLLAWGELWSALGTLSARLGDWSLSLVAGAPAIDPVAVALVWSPLLWMAAAWAGWSVRRRNQPLAALVPAGILLGTSLFYVRGNSAFLLPVLVVALLLMVVAGHYRRTRHWEATGVDFPLDLGLDVIVGGGAVVLALGMLAMLTPSVSVQEIAEWAGRLMRERFVQAQPVASSLGLDPRVSRSDTVFDQDRVRAPGLPRRHLLGSGPELSEQVVMVIYPEKDAGSEGQPGTDDELSPDQRGEEPTRYYWRSLTYNRYTGRGWITAQTEIVDYQAGDLAIYRDSREPLELASQEAMSILPARRVVRMDVRAEADLGDLLYAAGDLVTVDRQYLVAWRSPNDAFGATLVSPARTPPGQGRIDRQTRGDRPTVYQVTSLRPDVGEAQLQAVGSDYPAWVQYRYLALPDEIPARVHALARDLTATAPAPYDRARAIEAYLRTFPYTLDLPAPPVDRDVVDYFLFDLQQGYCDYYATAMVVLARAAGLPARLAMGYYTGIYDESNDRYIVTEADAHSWVEIYFPDYGWIEFEPTAGRAPIERPADVPPSVPPELEKLGPTVAETARVYHSWWLWLSSLVILPGLGIAAWWIVDGWRLRHLSPAGAAVVLYGRLRRHGRRLAVPMQPGDTPYEFVALLAEYVGDMARSKRWMSILLPADQEARWLAELYVRTCYAPHSPGAAVQAQAIRVWRKLRWRLWLAQAWRARNSLLSVTYASSSSKHRSGRLPAG